MHCCKTASNFSIPVSESIHFHAPRRMATCEGNSRPHKSVTLEQSLTDPCPEQNSVGAGRLDFSSWQEFGATCIGLQQESVFQASARHHEPRASVAFSH